MTMLIHELAQLTGISAKTIRYYESRGLLPPAHRATNGYRLYTEADAARLRFIVGVRTLGYPLAQIAQLLAARENGSLLTGQTMAALEAHLASIERKIADLQVVRDALSEIRSALVSQRPSARCDASCECHSLLSGKENTDEFQEPL